MFKSLFFGRYLRGNDECYRKTLVIQNSQSTGWSIQQYLVISLLKWVTTSHDKTRTFWKRNNSGINGISSRPSSFPSGFCYFSVIWIIYILTLEILCSPFSLYLSIDKNTFPFLTKYIKHKAIWSFKKEWCKKSTKIGKQTSQIKILEYKDKQV